MKRWLLAGIVAVVASIAALSWALRVDPEPPEDDIDWLAEFAYAR